MNFASPQSIASHTLSSWMSCVACAISSAKFILYDALCMLESFSPIELVLTS